MGDIWLAGSRVCDRLDSICVCAFFCVLSFPAAGLAALPMACQAVPCLAQGVNSAQPGTRLPLRLYNQCVLQPGTVYMCLSVQGSVVTASRCACVFF